MLTINMSKGSLNSVTWSVEAHPCNGFIYSISSHHVMPPSNLHSPEMRETSINILKGNCWVFIAYKFPSSKTKQETEKKNAYWLKYTKRT